MLFERMEQFLCRYAVKLGQREQIGSAGIGNALLPFGYSLPTDAERFGDEFLCHLTAFAMVLQGFSQRFFHLIFFFPDIFAV